MNRFDKSCVRAFFTLPTNLQSLPGTFTETLYAKPFSAALAGANSITHKGIKFYIIWFNDPEQLTTEDKIDLSFRDFSAYEMPPVVLIRKNFT